MYKFPSKWILKINTTSLKLLIIVKSDKMNGNKSLDTNNALSRCARSVWLSNKWKSWYANGIANSHRKSWARQNSMKIIEAIIIWLHRRSKSKTTMYVIISTVNITYNGIRKNVHDEFGRRVKTGWLLKLKKTHHQMFYNNLLQLINHRDKRALAKLKGGGGQMMVGSKNDRKRRERKRQL